jgi:hypothetical protein
MVLTLLREKEITLPVWYRRSTVKNVGRSISAIVLTIGGTFVALSIFTLTLRSIFNVQQDGVHLLLPATQVTPRFCKTLASLILHEYPNIVMTNYHGDTHHRAKIFSTLDYLERNITNAEDIVIIIDAYDTLAQQPLQKVLQHFEEQEGTIVFSAEKGCHPPQEDWCSQVPDSPLPKSLYGPNTDLEFDLTLNRPRWLNSGFVIGRAHALKTLYTAAAKMATELDGNFVADQSIFGPLFVNGSYGITLDYTSAIAQPMFFYEREVHFSVETVDVKAMHGAMHGAMQYVFDVDQPADASPIWKLRNLATGSTPAFVHFNLPDKRALDEYWPTFWYGGQSGLDVARSARQYVDTYGSVRRGNDGATMQYKDMCVEEEWGRGTTY